MYRRNTVMKRKQWLALLGALALGLTLLAGCGGQGEAPATDPAPAGSEQPEPPVGYPCPGPQADGGAPEETGPEGDSTAGTAEVLPDEPAPDPAEPPEPAPEPPEPKEQESEPEPAPEPEPEPEGESVMAGDTYTISVTLEGGSGRATVESPAKLRYAENKTCWATIVWSSPNFDYMKVDGQRYDPINTEGNSTFEIPVSVFDQPIAVIADTVAMSEPHEVEYTLTFDSASMEDA